MRHKVQEDLRKQSGQARAQKYARKAMVKLDPLAGGAKMGEEEVVFYSELEKKQKKRKKRKKERKEEL